MKLPLITIGCCLVLISTALAAGKGRINFIPQRISESSVQPEPDIKFTGAIVGEPTHMIFKMGATACLRGPLEIISPDTGGVLFALSEGVHYPTNCEKAQ